jgi:hypothetical protein
MRKCFPAIILMTGIFAVAVLHANGWTAAASTGVIDEADLNNIVLNNDGSASIASTVNSVTTKVRFNITDVSGVEPSEEEGQIGNIPGIEIAYRDNGPGARVYVKVKRIHIGLSISGGQLGTVDELATMDSDTHPASSGWQTMSSTMRKVDFLCCRTGLRFPDYAYVVEVQLIKSASTGNPGLLGLQFFNDQA